MKMEGRQSMTAILKERVLVLNDNWFPIDVTTVLKAVIAVFGERAKFVDPESYQTYSWEQWVEEWDDAAKMVSMMADRFISCPSCRIPVPEIIVTTDYDGIGCGEVKPHGRPKFSRKNLFLRDRGLCSYCGKKFPPHELNIDHVIPKFHKGLTTWTNVVLSCIRCNDRKGNKTLDEAGMRFIHKPFIPTAADLRVSYVDKWKWRVYGKKVPRSWKDFLDKVVSDMYWGVELRKE